VAGQIHGEARVAGEAEGGLAEAAVANGGTRLADSPFLEEADLALAPARAGQEVARYAARADTRRTDAARTASVAVDARELGEYLEGRTGAEALLVEQVVLALDTALEGSAAHACGLAVEALEPFGEKGGWAEAAAGRWDVDEVGGAGLAVVCCAGTGGTADGAGQALAQHLDRPRQADTDPSGAHCEARVAAEAGHPRAEIAEAAADQALGACLV
jgi:hypothetical protein